MDILIDKTAWKEPIQGQRMIESMGKRKTDPIPSSHPGSCIFKARALDLVLCCASPSGSEQWLCSPAEPVEPHVVCDPCRTEVYQAPAWLTLPPSLLLLTYTRKTLRQQRVTYYCSNKGFRCCTVWSFPLQIRVWRLSVLKTFVQTAGLCLTRLVSQKNVQPGSLSIPTQSLWNTSLSVLCLCADWALPALWVHLWRNAAESQCLHWEPGTARRCFSSHHLLNI